MSAVFPNLPFEGPCSARLLSSGHCMWYLSYMNEEDLVLASEDLRLQLVGQAISVRPENAHRGGRYIQSAVVLVLRRPSQRMFGLSPEE